MDPTVIALAISLPLILLGFLSASVQLRGKRILAERKLVPSDEQAYLQGRYRRRLFASALMILAGGMIAGAYLSGMERTADELKAQTAPDGTKKAISDDEKQFVRFWGVYWIAVILVTFGLVGIGLQDAISSRRFWLSQYKQLKEDHQVKLRRDLAVYRQRKDDRGAQRGKL